jgi:hypothetical protein
MRLLTRLSRLHIHTPAMIVNAVGAGECARCRLQRRNEAREVARLRRALKAAPQHPALFVAAAWMPPPHGHEALGRWRESWRALR